MSSNSPRKGQPEAKNNAIQGNNSLLTLVSQEYNKTVCKVVCSFYFGTIVGIWFL
jgi:hypothetical protein